MSLGVPENPMSLGVLVILRRWNQREKLGTLLGSRVSEIYTNIYHLYMGYIMVV